jgi:asparagine synthase (glutamine-hydrolysing)
MCAISGIILKSSNPQQYWDKSIRSVEEMVRIQRRRGPDGEGLWENKTCFLGHNRLSIVDLTDAGRQPMESKSWVITFNGEIFNYQEIRRELESCGHAFSTRCDTEVLLNSIEAYGVEKTVEKINGFFAFCAYNKITKQAYLVRDRLGIKPLFYFEDDSIIAFASLPSAIAKTIKRSWTLDREAVQGFFLLGATYSDRTFFDGIKRLDAACILKYDQISGSKTIWRYWRPKPRGESLIELAVDAVKIRKMGDVPMAVFFSGGIDSSFIASELKDIDAVHLISEEKIYAEAVASHLGINLHCVSCWDWNLDEVLQDFSSHTGEASMASPIPYMVSEKIRELGYKVAFSANGADELFYGYQRTPTPGINRNRFRYKPHEGIGSITLRMQILNIFRNPAHFCVPDSKTKFSVEELEEFLSQKYYLDEFNQNASYRWLELQTYVLYDLNATLDYTSMAHGLEVRTPFLDYRVVERALSSTIDELITANAGRKAPLKMNLLRKRIPEECVQREKVGFSLDQKFAENEKRKQIGSVIKLSERNLLKINHEIINDTRSSNYIMASASALEAWCKVWIDDAGIVTM